MAFALRSSPALQADEHVSEEKYKWLLEGYQKLQQVNSFLEERILNAVDGADRDNELLRKALSEAHERFEKAEERIYALEKECEQLRNENACLSRQTHVFLDVNDSQKHATEQNSKLYQSSGDNIVPHNGTFLTLPIMSPFASCTAAAYTHLINAAVASTSPSSPKKDAHHRRPSSINNTETSLNDADNLLHSSSSSILSLNRTRSAAELHSPTMPHAHSNRTRNEFFSESKPSGVNGLDSRKSSSMTSSDSRGVYNRSVVQIV